MNPKDVIDIPTMDEFYRLRDSLNLSDRQKEVFFYKYSKLWRNIDIAEELGIHPDTVSDDLTVIRNKLVAVHKSKCDKNP